jgi:hypothetical protein
VALGRQTLSERGAEPCIATCDECCGHGRGRY